MESIEHDGIFENIRGPIYFYFFNRGKTLYRYPFLSLAVLSYGFKCKPLIYRDSITFSVSFYHAPKKTLNFEDVKTMLLGNEKAVP